MQKSFRAFVYAINGLRYAVVNERNFRIEILCAIFTIAMAFIFKITMFAWLIIVINICIVLAAELFNTAIEKLADISFKEINPIIEIIKDVAAAAVLISVLSALICGVIIFIPYIFKLINL
jgi:diacylglycerol kinase